MLRIAVVFSSTLCIVSIALQAQERPSPPRTPNQVVPIVGHVSGSGGSEFRSDLKIYNPSSTPLTLTLIYTPRNQSASTADASEVLSIAPFEVVFLEDVYDFAFPGQSGAARLALVLADPYGPALVTDTSTYTLVGQKGELGQSPTIFTEAQYFGTGVKLIGLLGKATERTNLFVMTGQSGVTIRWRYRTSYGDPIQLVVRTYSPNATFQFGATDLLGFPPEANASLEATIESGSARIALSPVNNMTNQGRWADFKVVP